MHLGIVLTSPGTGFVYGPTRADAGHCACAVSLQGRNHCSGGTIGLSRELRWHWKLCRYVCTEEADRMDAGRACVGWNEAQRKCGVWMDWEWSGLYCSGEGRGPGEGRAWPVGCVWTEWKCHRRAIKLSRPRRGKCANRSGLRSAR